MWSSGTCSVAYFGPVELWLGVAAAHLDQLEIHHRIIELIQVCRRYAQPQFNWPEVGNRACPADHMVATVGVHQVMQAGDIAGGIQRLRDTDAECVGK